MEIRFLGAMIGAAWQMGSQVGFADAAACDRECLKPGSIRFLWCEVWHEAVGCPGIWTSDCGAQDIQMRSMGELPGFP
jgi:hypothetical protein